MPSFNYLYDIFFGRQPLASPIETSFIDEILEIFYWLQPFQFSEENIQKINDLKNINRKLFTLFAKSIISWEFLWNEDKLVELKKVISGFNDDISNLNLSETNEEFWKVFKILSFIKSIIFSTEKLIRMVKSRRKDPSYEIWWDEEEYFDEDVLGGNQIEFQIYWISHNIFLAEFWSTQNGQEHRIKSIILDTLYQLEKLKKSVLGNQENKDILDFLILKVYFLLYKNSIKNVSRKWIYEAFDNTLWEAKEINTKEKLDWTCFEKTCSLLNFLHTSKDNAKVSSLILDEINKVKKVSNKDDLTCFQIFILLKYYKDFTWDFWALEDLFNDYKNSKFKKDLNVIYIWNNLLSCLIDIYEETKDNKIANKIDILYRDLSVISKNIKKYRNYFTDFKYAKYKNLQYTLEKEKLEIISLKKILGEWEQKISNAFDFFNSTNYFWYFDFDKEDDKIYTWNQHLPVVYCFSKLAAPFDKEFEKRRLESEREKILSNKLDLKLFEWMKQINQSLVNSKFEPLALIWVFASLALYSFWTFQIFTIITELSDAILVSTIFLSWVLLLSWAIFWHFSQIKLYKNWLIFLAFWILILWFAFKFYSNDELNLNKSSKINSELQSTIDKWEKLKQDMNKINSELSEKKKSQ